MSTEEDCQGLERKLTEDLVNLVASQVVYSVRRLLPADLKQLYVGAGNHSAIGVNPFHSGQILTNNDKLGGVFLAPYLTYNWFVAIFNSMTLFIELNVRILFQYPSQ